MNLNQLRFVRAVAELGSFSQAARACHIGQPSLSTAIAQLEEELGGRIFERTTRSVALTPLGARLLPLFEGLLGSEVEIRAVAQAWRRTEAKLLRVGFSPAAALGPIQMALDVYGRDHPGLEVVYKECRQDDLEERLASGTIDLGLTIRGGRRADRSVLLHEEPLVVLASGGSKAGGPVPIASLSGATMLFTAGCGLAETVRETARRARVPHHEYRGQALSYRVVEEWADLGLGTGVLPRSKITGASTGPLVGRDGKQVMVGTYAVWGPDKSRARQMRALATWLAERTGSLARGTAPATPTRPSRSTRG